ncbi:hypothetical protein C8R46DRAFT_1208283 [Mycena filopes]|nr:hypothetical protein C8R46DRAFT_1208283 [Mycena filopes]
MSFALRQFPLFSTRFVHVYGQRVYELWSPNSDIPAFLPGVRPPPAIIISKAHAVQLQPRYDGHLGKYDCLHVPQYSEEDIRHWAFLRRASTVQAGDWNAEAYLPFVSQWVDQGSRGHLHPDFVLRLSAINRELEERKRNLERRFGATFQRGPSPFPSHLDIQLLGELKSWDEAVDRGVAVQRGLRVKEAWLEGRYAMASVEEPKDLESLRARDMPVALEYRMGAWVNGCPEITVLWLMAARVPVFVVSELEDSEATQFRNSAASNFLEGTDVEEFLSDSNPYEAIAREQMLLDSIHPSSFSMWRPESSATDQQRRWAWSSVLLEQDNVSRDVGMGTEGERLDWQLLTVARPAELSVPSIPSSSAPLTVPSASPPRPADSVSTTSRVQLTASRVANHVPVVRSIAPTPASAPQVAAIPSAPRPYYRGQGWAPSMPHSAPSLATGWGTPAWPQDEETSAAWSNISDWNTTDSERLPRQHAARGADDSVTPPSSSAASSRTRNPDLYAPPALKFRVIDDEHEPWVIAPDVAPENTSKARYEKFELRRVEGLLQWVLVSRTKEISSKNAWVDRVRKRRLHFGEFIIPGGVVDSDVFGAPVPPYQFVVPDGNKYTPTKASHWMYRTAAPRRGDAGRKQQPPHPNQLPPRRNLAKSKDLEKAKGKAVAMYDDNDDYSDDEPDGMDVDVWGPSEAERPSSCVVLDGADSTYTAAMFYGLSDDRLRGVRAAPTVILNAQQRIWLRFATVTEGQRAFGALPGLANGLQVSFASIFSFEDAQRYTRDIWTPDLMEDVQSTNVPWGGRSSSARERLQGEPSEDAAISTTLPLAPAPTSPLSPSSPPQRSPPQSLTPPPREPAPPTKSAPSLTSPPAPSAVTVTSPSPPRPAVLAPVRVPVELKPVTPLIAPTSRAATAAREPPREPRNMRLPLGDRLTDAPSLAATRWGYATEQRPLAPLPSRALQRGNLMALLPRLSDARAPASSSSYRGGQSLVPLPLRLSTPPLSAQGLVPLPLRLSTPEPPTPDLHPLLDSQVVMNNFGEIVTPGLDRTRTLSSVAPTALRGRDEEEKPPRKKKKPRRGNRAGVQAKAQEARREQRRREEFEEEPDNLRWNDSENDEDPPVAGPSH